ncbi:hypothetical protein LCGC14_0364590 [marine sediment metagenome]|uniref:YqaJ viral recombinase domain-containing protein n=1 Tax=marine sediment metagenome TaxID=412755 RepID=A0A0F9TPT2_9ZZZZ
MIYHDIEQGSDEYCELKLGKISSSHFSEIMVNTINRGGEFDSQAKWGVGAKDYAARLALERKTKKRLDSFQNDWMQRGNRLEPEARQKYECKTFQLVENGGLFINGDLATSPDGLIEKGGIEIKCVKYNTQFAVMEAEFYDTKYKWQMQGQMLVANLKFVDFVSYCPEHPKETELYIYRVEKNNVNSDQITKRLEHFKELIADYEKMIGGNNGK